MYSHGRQPDCVWCRCLCVAQCLVGLDAQTPNPSGQFVRIPIAAKIKRLLPGGFSRCCAAISETGEALYWGYTVYNNFMGSQISKPMVPPGLENQSVLDVCFGSNIAISLIGGQI